MHRCKVQPRLGFPSPPLSLIDRSRCAEGVLLFDSQREGWPVLYSNRAARELLEGPAAGGAVATNCQIQAGVPLWKLLTPAPDVGIGAEEAVQKARKAVAAGQSVTLACHAAAGSLAAWSRSASNSSHSSAEGAAAAATAALGASGDFCRSSAAARGAVPATNVTGLQAQPSPFGRMASGGSTASWDDVERVLTGRASLDALLGGCHAASGSNQAACNGAQPPSRLSVTLTCAAAPDCGSRHPAVGIPAANAVWSGAGSLHSSGACGSAAPSPASAAAPCRLWFAQISGTDAGSAALPQPGSCAAPCAASGGGVSEPALLAPWLMPAAHEGLLRPQELAGLQLGPLLGAGASGRWGTVCHPSRISRASQRGCPAMQPGCECICSAPQAAEHAQGICPGAQPPHNLNAPCTAGSVQDIPLPLVRQRLRSQDRQRVHPSPTGCSGCCTQPRRPRQRRRRQRRLLCGATA